MSKYVWYVGYGSNLSKQRFLCYIVGGIPMYGKKENGPCRDSTMPTADKQFRIPYRLYFALPTGKTETANWGKGGVAFISPTIERNENNWSLCRMWKITDEQYAEVWQEEGNSDTWYGKEISLGNDENGVHQFHK